MQKENPALTTNGREPRLPVGGTLDWKETPFLTASHQRPRVARSGNQGRDGRGLGDYVFHCPSCTDESEISHR